MIGRSRAGVGTGWAIALAALTVAAFALRLPGFDQSLFGDELLTYAGGHDGLGHVWDVMDQYERNPPLYFVAAWLSGKLGDPTVWIRLPSLILGTATVPLVYLLGARAVGRAGALFGAAVMAVSPFAIFYSDEARPYATLIFLVALSTLLLVRAVESGGLGRWALVALASCAALYTHYLAVFALAVHAAWVLWFHRDRSRELLLAYAAIALAYLPWLPTYLGQDAVVFSARPWSLQMLLKVVGRVLPGHPFIALRDLPGRPLLVVFCLGLALALLGAALALRRAPPTATADLPRRDVVWLLVALALATPILLSVYDLFGANLLYPRNLAPSLPAACVLIGALVAGLPRPVALVAGVLVLGVLAVAGIQNLSADNGRPDYKAVAHFIDTQASPEDPVVHVFLGPPVDPASRGVIYQFKRPHDAFVYHGNESLAWRRAENGGHVFVVYPDIGPFHAAPPAPPARFRPCFTLQSKRLSAGFVRIGVLTYAGRAAARC